MSNTSALSGISAFFENPKDNLQKFSKTLLVPLVGLLIFLFVWEIGAKSIKTSLGAFPGPVAVYEQTINLVNDHQNERAKETAFYERQEKRNAKKLEKDPNAKVKIRPYTGNPTFFDQIGTSLVTVLSGFIMASLIAIPVGIVIGLNNTLYSALNPLI